MGVFASLKENFFQAVRDIKASRDHERELDSVMTPMEKYALNLSRAAVTGMPIVPMPSLGMPGIPSREELEKRLAERRVQPQ